MMRTISKRLAALMTALALMLTGLGALAEASPAEQTPQSVYERGSFVKSDVRIQLDAGTLTGLLAMFGAGSTGAEADAEKVISLITQALNALNKIKFTVVSGKDAMSMTAGTDLGQIMDMQANMKEGASAITSSLLPGMMLTMAQDPKAAQVQSLVERHKKAIQTIDFEKLGTPYLEVLNKFFLETLTPKATLAESPVTIADVGTFDVGMTFDVDNHMIAELLTGLMAVLKQDSVVRPLIDAHLKAGATYAAGTVPQGTEAPAVDEVAGATPKNADELIAKLEEGIAKMKAMPAAVLFHQGVYTSTTGETLYTTTEDKDGKGLLTVAFVPSGLGDELKISFLSKKDAPNFGTVDPAATPAPVMPVDWAAVKAGVLDGTDFSSTLILIDIKGSEDAAKNQQEMSADIKLYSQGMQLGLQAKGSSTLSAPYASKGDVSFSFLSPTPLLTISFENSEVAEGPVLPDVTGLKVMALDGTASSPQGELMQTLQKTALPLLIENLKKALPEEAAILLAYLQTTPPVTTTPN
ncbi:MAG: hypothetical protein AB9880_06895 [Christensenellales bacterium]